MITTPRRFLATAATLAMLTGLAACGDGGGTVDEASADATSLDDFGSFEELEEAAIEEGALNVIALPRDWANYGEILDLFIERYPDITVTEASPSASSAEEITAAENLQGQDTAPDTFDLGAAVAQSNTDMFAPYQVEGWDDIPAELKEESGLYVGDYGGYMSIGYDPDAVPAPEELDDLLGADYQGKVALNGDPTQAGAAFAAVGLATVQRGGDLDDFTPGIEFFSELNDAGNFLKLDPTPATVASGETPVVFDWDYLNTGYAADLEGNRTWEIVVLPGTGYAGYYYQAINKDAPHPAAARLWQEFLYSDEVQNLWLKGGARPARADAMVEAGTIDTELWDALPPVPEDVVTPTMEQSEGAATLLGDTWASAVD